jgi:hypothetical protein
MFQFGGYKTHTDFSKITSYAWHFHIRYKIARSGLWVPAHAIDGGFSGTLLGEPVVKNEGRCCATATDARWVDALAYQYGKVLFVGKVWQEEEGVRKSVIVE